MPSSYAVAAFATIFLGYLVTSAALWWCFYRRRAHEKKAWKVQPSKRGNEGRSGGIPWTWRSSPEYDRAPEHALFATTNLVTASTFAALTAESTVRGVGSTLYSGGIVLDLHRGVGSTLYSSGGYAGGLVLGVLSEAARMVLGLAVQSVLEYYWHRLMHLPAVYRRLHKYHHHYKAPSCFTDMFIHPLEAVGYYVVLYSPSFLVPMHVVSFCVYMTILGAAGILDHSGIDVRVLGVYDTRDHDAHHSRTHVNYGFPFPLLDIWHDTYHGEFLGKKYVPGQRNHSKQQRRGAEEEDDVCKEH